MVRGLLAVVAIGAVIGVGWFMKKDSPPNGGDNSKNPPTSQPADTGAKQEITGSGTYAFNTQESAMRWEGKKILIPGYTDKGVIKIKEGQVKVENGLVKSGSLMVDTTSIEVKSTGKNSGETMLTRHLKSADFFDVEKYPTSEFKITKVTKAEGEFAYTMRGDLTIKDITKSVTFPVTIYTQGDKVKAQARFELDRTQWDIRYASGKFFKNIGDKVIGDKFVIEFDVVGEKLK